VKVYKTGEQLITRTKWLGSDQPDAEVWKDDGEKGLKVWLDRGDGEDRSNVSMNRDFVQAWEPTVVGLERYPSEHCCCMPAKKTGLAPGFAHLKDKFDRMLVVPCLCKTGTGCDASCLCPLCHRTNKSRVRSKAASKKSSSTGVPSAARLS